MFYTTFIIDVFSRAIVGWKISTRMTIDVVVNALAETVNGS
ncbi:putative insB [Acinetobacter baumannii 1440422]|nr:putative insB [Acinetobacter baumannii 1440422]